MKLLCKSLKHKITALTVETMFREPSVIEIKDNNTLYISCLPVLKPTSRIGCSRTESTLPPGGHSPVEMAAQGTAG